MQDTAPLTHFLVFGDQAVEKLSSIQSLVRNSRTSALARSFLEKATDVVQLEFAQLSPEARGWDKEIHSLLGLAEDNIKIEREQGEGKVNGIVATVLMCIGRIGELCVFAEEDPSILGSESFPTHILAFCTGLLPAAVAAAARDTSEILHIGVEMIRIVFRLAFAIIRRMKLVDNIGGTWATTILRVSRQEVERILGDFHTQHNTPEARKVAIGVEAADWLTLVGPPSSLERLWSWSTVLDRAAKTKTDTNGAIHTEHMPAIDVEEVLRDSAILDIPLSGKARIGRNSGNGFFGASNLGDLLREMIVEIANKVLKSTATIKECVSSLVSDRAVKLTIVGPTPYSPTIQRILLESRVVYHLNQHSEQKADPLRGGSNDIAIVGVSGRFPGSESVEGFWEDLQAGKNLIKEVPKSRWDINEYYDPTGKKRNSTTARHGSWLDRPGLFDHKLFNISPREATQMDPIQRLLLTTSYEALEVAGYSPDATPATCSNRMATYLGQAAEDWHEILNNEGVDIYYVPSISRAFGPSRLNYYYKWGGGSYAVDSACATSTTAISLACAALKARECDTALAGGGSVLVSPNSFSALSKSGMISTTGGCRTYHDDADGYARGEAVAVVVLKRLEDAISDNDNILGVIRGSARTYSAEATSITHPDGEAQKRVCDAVLRQNCIDPSDISYVEMHGTGTQAGDAIEMESVLQAVGKSRTEQNPLTVGAVKANCGHGEGAAGVTSLVKVLMMLRDRVIPPQPDAPFKINRNFPPLEKLNVHIAGKDMKLRPRQGGDGNISILLNSFDASGGNTALLVENGPAKARKSGDPRPFQVVALSARSSTSLHKSTQRLLEFMERNFETTLADIAYTSTARRMHQPLRKTYVAATNSELVGMLRSNISKPAVKEPTRKNAKSTTIFAFTGQGGKFSSMGEQLYKHSTTFRRLVTTYQEMADLQNLPHFIDLIANGCQDLSSESPSRMHLAIVTLEVAIAQTLKMWGLQPDLVIGHSLGEYAALAVADVLSISDMLHLVGQRAVLVEKHLEAGQFAMLAIQASIDEVRTRILHFKSAQIACMNAPTTTVVSCNKEDAGSLQESLSDEGIKATMLNMAYGFHSKQVEPILQEYEAIANGVIFNEPGIPVASTLSGTVVKDTATFSSQYLARQTRENVNLIGALQAAENNGFVTERTRWVELGPESILAGLIRATLKTPPERMYPIVKSNVNEWKSISTCLAAFYESGIPVKWPEFHRDFQKSLNLIHLPTYAFDETDFWTSYREPERKDLGGVASSPTKITSPQLLSTSLQRVEHEKVAGKEASVIFTSQIAQPDLLASIKAHIVDGITVCPIGVFSDMALAASDYIMSKLQLGQKASEMAIHDIELTHPLVVQESNSAQTVTVTATYLPVDNVIKVSFSSNENGKTSHHHGDCQVAFGNSEKWKAQANQTLFLAKSRIAALKEKARFGRAHRLLKPMVYKMFSSLVWYGDRYRDMDEVIFDAESQDVVANVTLSSMEGAGSFHVNPYWMDSTVHAAGFMLNGIMKYPEDVVCLSTGFKSWRLFSHLSPGKNYTSYVCLQEIENGSAISGDAYVFDGEDLVLATLGLRYQKMKRTVMRRLFLAGERKKLNAAETTRDSRLAASPKQSHTRTVKDEAPAVEIITPPSRTSSPSTSDTGSTTTPATEIEDASSEIVSKLLAAVAEESGCDLTTLDDDTDFTDMGLDSLMAMTIIANLKNDTGYELPATFFVDSPTIGSAKTALRPNEEGKSDKKIHVESIKSIDAYPSFDKKPAVTITELDSASDDEHKAPPPPTITPTNVAPTKSSVIADITVLQGTDKSTTRMIFLMPDWSGSAVPYIQLPPLGENLCVFGLESPYKKPKNADIRWSFDDMTDTLVTAVRRNQPNGPYLLGGASFGALYAAEVARKLLQMGESVDGLLIVGMFVPKPGLGVGEGDHSEESVIEELERSGYLPTLKRMTKTQRAHLISTINAYANGYKQGTSWEEQPAKIVQIRGSGGKVLPPWLGVDDRDSWQGLVGSKVECREVEADSHALLRYPHINNVGQICKDAVQDF